MHSIFRHKKNEVACALAQSYEYARRDFVHRLSFLSAADSCAGVMLLLMLSGIFLPWFADDHVHAGIMRGGTFHLMLVIFAYRKWRAVASYHRKAVQKKYFVAMLSSHLRKVSLSYMVAGFLSTLSSLIILLYFSTYHGDIRMGFYVTTFAGLLLFFCGLPRFYSASK